MLIQSFEDWRAAKRRDWEEDDPEINCPKCDGEGEIYETCPCCGHDSDDFCETCQGSGRLQFNQLDSADKAAMLTRGMYQKEVIADLKLWCAYTRQDFLVVVAPFIQSQRSGGSATAWR